jgi:hypothetical protein
MQRAQRMQPFSRPWLLTTASAVAGVAVIGVYIVIIVSEGNDSAVEISPWVVVMGVAVLLPVMALFSRNRAIVAGCLIGCAAIWTVMAAISLFVLPLPAIFLSAFAYDSYRKSTKAADTQSDDAPMVSP